MSSSTNKQIIQSIRNGQEDVLFYLAKKYFHAARRQLRRSGFSYEATLKIFIDVLIRVYREVQQKNISENVDFEIYFFNSLREFVRDNKLSNDKNEMEGENSDIEIAASCYSILDEASKKMISSRFLEKLSFEEIATRHNLSNPIIAQFEFNKAFVQLEKIASVRMNFDLEL